MPRQQAGIWPIMAVWTIVARILALAFYLSRGRQERNGLMLSPLFGLADITFRRSLMTPTEQEQHRPTYNQERHTT